MRSWLSDFEIRIISSDDVATGSTSPRKLREARKILEIVIPPVFAGVALFLSRASLSTFTAALFSAFKP
jgi:hypothetical protein